MPDTSSPARLPEVFAEGDNRELGRQHGRSASDLIHHVLDRHLAHSSQHAPSQAILDRAMQYLPYVHRYAPELLDEVSGIAEGAHLTFEEAFFLQVATEFESRSIGGCSSLADARDPTKAFIAQNWDQPSETRDEQIILHLHPADKPAIVMYTRAGVLGYIGMNSYGVGHVNNQLYASIRPLGLTGYFITRKLLGFQNVADGLSWLSDVQVGSSGSYILADTSAKNVIIELGDGTFRCIEAPVLTRTNHYLTNGWAAVDRAPEFLPDSLPRMRRLTQTFAGIGGEAAAFAALRDHDNFPASVCRHDSGGGTQTMASILMRLNTGELLVCQGNPCEGSYVAYHI